MRIGEVSEYSGVSRRMLRYYDAAGIVSPSQRDPNGYRNYSDEDLARLVTLETLREIGLSLESAAELLARPHTLSTVMDQAIASLRQRLAALFHDGCQALAARPLIDQHQAASLNALHLLCTMLAVSSSVLFNPFPKVI